MSAQYKVALIRGVILGLLTGAANGDRPRRWRRDL
jgi:hypothetical protein